MLLISACGSGTPPVSPTPTGDPPTANVYILPGAVDLGANAFGDEAIVIFKGERMRWRNLDAVEHTLVPDTPLPGFDTTGALAPGGDRSFLMLTTGTTRIHCTEHPQMVGTLVVRER
jgi:plastocyanin